MFEIEYYWFLFFYDQAEAFGYFVLCIAFVEVLHESSNHSANVFKFHCVVVDIATGTGGHIIVDAIPLAFVFIIFFSAIRIEMINMPALR
ncbi:MAG TPA: hypothetical protein VLC28_00670 [Flavitalea sp.]|nr:hypothetical protein [Flavitalea sp.]